MRLPDPGARAWIDGRAGTVEALGIPLADPVIHAGLQAEELDNGFHLGAGRAVALARDVTCQRDVSKSGQRR